jgi:hypothetical protein
LGYTLGVFFHELIWSPCSGEKKEGKKVVACFAFRQSGMETKDAKMFFLRVVYTLLSVWKGKFLLVKIIFYVLRSTLELLAAPVAVSPEKLAVQMRRRVQGDQNRPKCSPTPFVSQ